LGLGDGGARSSWLLSVLLEGVMLWRLKPLTLRELVRATLFINLLSFGVLILLGIVFS
jgi:hypothetical protein